MSGKISVAKALAFFSLVAFFSWLYTLPVQARAETDLKGWGLGVILGEPTALSAKYRLSPSNAYDFGFGYSFGHSVQLFSDYLFLYPGTFQSSAKEHLMLVPYWGLGASLAFYASNHKKSISNNDARFSLAVRIPLGVALPISKSPIEVFAELVPLVYFVPGIDLGLNGGLGLRFFF